MAGDRVPQVGERWEFMFRDGGNVEIRGVLVNGDGKWFVAVEYASTRSMVLTELTAFVKSYRFAEAAPVASLAVPL